MATALVNGECQILTTTAVYVNVNCDMHYAMSNTLKSKYVNK